MRSPRGTAVLLAAALLVGGARAQAQDRALDLERRGNYAAAADAYKAVLAARPGDVGALLGLERTLGPLKRVGEAIPAARAATAAGAPPVAALGVELRAWVALGEPDSARLAAERWAAASPGDDTPYREWGAALLGERDRSGARQAYLAGRKRLGPDVLAAEMAEVSVLEGDFAGSVKEWLAAMDKVPGYRMSAVATLSQAPERSRAGVLRELDAAHTPAARRMAAELAARYGDPLGGLERLRQVLPAAPVEAVEALRQFLDQVRTLATPESARAQGMALELMAERLPPAQAGRVRLDAAQAYTEAGDRAATRRMLDLVADQRDANPALARGVTATLVGVLLDEGKVEDASRRLEEAKGTLGTDEYEALRLRVLQAWVRRGEFDRVERALAGDSAVEAMALAGMVSAYRGDLANARARLAAAGPFAGSRSDATDRAALLALLQPIDEDSLPALGRALWELDRADTAAAVAGLVEVAGALDPVGGGAGLRLLAGRLEAARGRVPQAEALLREAAGAPEAATAPAANLELARLLLDTGRKEEAVTVLERLLLTWPQSAMAPPARRLLDTARGAVPQT